MSASAIEQRHAGTQSHSLLQTAVVIAMVVPAIVATVVTSPVPIDVRLEAALLCALCLLPSWSYLRAAAPRRRPIPFMPIIGLLYALYFALPAALGAYNQHYKIVLSPAWDYDEAVFVALAGWVSLLLSMEMSGFLFPIRMGVTRSAVPDQRLRNDAALLILLGLAVDVVRKLFAIPIEIAGVLIFGSSLGWFGSGLLVMLNVRRQLTTPWRLLTYVGVIGFFALAIASGSVAAAAFYGTVVVVAAWIGRGRLSLAWLVGILIGGVVIVSLRGVSEQYRKIVWYQEQGGGIVQRTQLFFELLQQRVETDGIEGAISQGFETTAGRSANLDLLADVIRRTPNEVPYWEGSTYLSLVGAFVPRFLWPDKPTKELGQAFGHRYGYVGVNDNGTAINLPILVEFFINFGTPGVLFGMAIVGLIYRLVERAVNNPGQDDILSLAGIVLMIPLTNIESDFSLGFGGLILNGLALWLVLRLMGRGRVHVDAREHASQDHAAMIPIHQRSN